MRLPLWLRASLSKSFLVLLIMLGLVACVTGERESGPALQPRKMAHGTVWSRTRCNYRCLYFVPRIV